MLFTLLEFNISFPFPFIVNILQLISFKFLTELSAFHSSWHTYVSIADVLIFTVWNLSTEGIEDNYCRRYNQHVCWGLWSRNMKLKLFQCVHFYMVIFCMYDGNCIFHDYSKINAFEFHISRSVIAPNILNDVIRSKN